ncbi:MAG: alpha/beta hydrolase family protein [Anaerolineaceae bacterium]
MKKRSNVVILCFVLAFLLVVTACSSGNTTTQEAEGPEAAEKEESAVEESEPDEVAVPNGLAEEEIEIEFTTSDGRTLTGTYYPAVTLDAPVVILMHWVMGEKTDWTQIAYWLQNRGLAGVTENSTGINMDMPWLDSTWFPPMPADQSYNVFAFTFYNCENGGCMTIEREKWELDAQAAYETAMTLEGVDPTRIIGIGASIGADAVADGCLYINTVYPDTCQGALSLSAGSYLTLNYKNVVDELNTLNPAVPVQCFYSTGDAESAPVCESIPENENYSTVKYEGSLHGMMLIQPDLEHDTLSLIQEFLNATVGRDQGY